MPKRTTDYRSNLLQELKDPAEASHYLNAALRDSEEMFLVALRDVAEAHQMAKVAESAGVSRESVYRMLSPSGNPTYRNLLGILRALDLELVQVRPRLISPGSFVPHIPPTSSVPRSSVVAHRFKKQRILKKRELGGTGRLEPDVRAQYSPNKAA